MKLFEGGSIPEVEISSLSSRGSAAGVVCPVGSVVCWLIRHKARVQTSGTTSKRNYENISSATAVKNLLKNLSFGVDFKL